MAFDANPDEIKQTNTLIRRSKSSPVIETKTEEKVIVQNENYVVNAKKDTSFLHQDQKTIDEATNSAPRNIPLWENDARVKTLQTMNVIRSLSPVISVAIREASEDQQQAEIFTELMSKVNQLAVITGTIIGADTENKMDKWIFNTLERVFSESVINSDLLHCDTAEKFAHAVVAATEERLTDKEEFTQISSDIHMKIAMIKAISPVITEQQKFDFFRNKEEDTELLSDIIFEKTANAVIELVDPFTKEQERVIIFQILSEVAGKTLAESWSLAAKILKEDLNNKTDREIEILKNANPNGFPISSVIESFEENFRKLIELSKNIKLPPKKRY